MSQFFISCKESKIENNRSFYGCFNIGPFEPSQSITIANALRRTLLSELYGLSIVSVEMEGVTHEYSNLTGVKDSVLDILLNLKDIVLKKTINTIGIKPQIGYLKIRGPGVVRAAHLKLPPFIQSVDPDQYIATLTHDGFINMKFIIQYSNKWLSNQNFKSDNYSENETKDFLNQEEIKSQINLFDCTSEFSLHLKKRRLILKKLKQIGLKNSNLYINLFSKFIYKQSKKITISGWKSSPEAKMNFLYSKNYFLNKTNFNSPWTSYLQVPALKLLKIKTKDNSYLLTPLKSFEFQKKRKISQVITSLVNKHSNKYLAINLRNNRILNNSKKLNTNFNNAKGKNYSNRLGNPVTGLDSLSIKKNGKDNMNFISNKVKKIGSTKKLSNFFNSTPLTIDSIFNPVTKVNYIIEVNDFKISQAQFSKSNETLELLDLVNISNIETKLVNLNSSSIMNLPEINSGLDFKGSGLNPSEAKSMLYSKNSNNILNSSSITAGMVKPLAAWSNPFQGSTMQLASGNPLEEDYSTKNSIFLENILELKNEINFLKKETPKHNIIFEIWTNGSMHPRDAIYQGFKNLVRIFSKLNKINAFMIKPLTLSSLENNFLNNNEINSAKIKKNYFLKKIKQNEIASTITDPLMLSTQTSNLTTLNDVSFLSTYMRPKLKNFYLTTCGDGSDHVAMDSNKWSRGLSNVKDNNAAAWMLGLAVSEHPAAWSNPFQGSTMQAAINSNEKDPEDRSLVTTVKEMPSNLTLLDNSSIQSQIPIIDNVNLKRDIGILNLSLRSFSSLKRLNINTIKELKLFLISKNKSLDFKKLSKICLEEIEQSLQKLE